MPDTRRILGFASSGGNPLCSLIPQPRHHHLPPGEIILRELRRHRMIEMSRGADRGARRSLRTNEKEKQEEKQADRAEEYTPGDMAVRPGRDRRGGGEKDR